MYFSRRRSRASHRSAQAPSPLPSNPAQRDADDVPGQSSTTDDVPRRGSITDDWQEVASSSSTRTRRSSLDDDVSVLSWHSSDTLDVDQLRATAPSELDLGTSDTTSVLNDDAPPDYELIAPSTQGYSTLHQTVPESSVANDCASSSPEPASPRRLRHVSSDATLVDPHHTSQRKTAFSLKQPHKNGQQCSVPYQFPSFASSTEASTSSARGHQSTIQQNPTVYLFLLCALIKNLDLVNSLIQESIQVHAVDTDDGESLDKSSPYDTLNNLKDAVGALSSQVHELEPILRVYANHYVAHGSGLAAGHLPLDVCLRDWMQSADSHVLVLQQALVSATETKGLDDAELRRLHGVMADFLPIIKTDFDLFSTHLMTFPSLQVRGEPATPARYPPPNPHVARMRRQLYDLKDQIQAHHDILKNLRGMFPLIHRQQLNKALGLLTAVLNAISTILTNNGSEWIESDLASGSDAQTGVLPYADFVSLDADVLHDVAAHLRHLHEDLALSSVPLEEICFTATPLRNHQLHTLFRGGALETLVSTLEFTKSLLMPRME